MELRSGSVVGQEKPTSSSSASSTVVGRLTNEAVAVLGEGIRLCFLRWTALQLAVENEWGGHTSKLKAQQLQSDVLSWFTRSKGPRYIDELENLLDENLVELFNTTADDGSVEEVAEQLMVIHEECTQGNYATVQQLSDAAAKEVSKPAVAQSRQLPTEGDDEEYDNDDDDDVEFTEADSMDVDNIPQQESASLASGVASSRARNFEQLPKEEHAHQQANTSGVAPRSQIVADLSEQDLAEGWQAAPTRTRRRGTHKTS